MRIEVHNGYRISVRSNRTGTHHSYEEVCALLTQFRQAARPIIQTLVNKRAAYLCARIIDQRALELMTPIDGTVVPEAWSPLIGATSILLDRFEHWYATGVPNRVYSLDAHVTITQTSHEVVALLWTEQPQIVEAWEQLDGVAPFAYWDDDLFSGRPDNVSEAEWAIRRGVWQEIAGRGSWDCIGLSTCVIGRYGLPSPHIDGVMAYIPDASERARLYAAHRAVSRQHRAIQIAEPDNDPLVALDQAIGWCKGTREGRAAYNVEHQALVDFLPDINALTLVHEEEPPPAMRQ